MVILVNMYSYDLIDLDHNLLLRTWRHLVVGSLVRAGVARVVAGLVDEVDGGVLLPNREVDRDGGDQDGGGGDFVGSWW